MYIPSPGGGDGGGGHVGGEELLRPPLEHRCAIYRDKAHYGPVSGSRAAARGAVFEAVMVTGGTQYGGDTGGGMGGGGEEGLGILVGIGGGGIEGDRKLIQKEYFSS